jgi:predicted metalloprotease with PDZ domain
MRAVGLALAAIFLASACAEEPEAPAPRTPVVATPPPPPPAPPPEAPLLAGVDVSYALEIVKDPFPFVEVTLVTHGAPSGTTHLRLSDWGGIEHSENEVHALTVTGEDGRRLPIEHGEWALWTLHHAPGALLRVKYALVSTQYDVGYGSESYYRPLLSPSFFHIIGNTALMHVGDVPAELPQHFSLHWKGFKEIGWKVASSFSVDQDGFDVTATSDDFRQAVFLAGEMRLVRRDVHGAPLWLAIAGNEWGFFDNALADAAAKVVTAQRTFFEDYDWPFFLISVIPIGRYNPGSYSQGGTGLTHSFAIFLTPKTDLSAKGDGTGVTWLLSHELFHLWNGHRYKLAEPEPLGYWFSEGFTNFYARRLLFRAGLLDKAAFLANLNDEVARYLVSPVKREPASRIAQDFWNDKDVEKLPYLRGDVVALLVDAEIRAVSHGNKSLDDLMKELLGAKKDPAPNVTPETFLARIASYTSDGFADKIRKIVVDGAPAALDPKLLEPCLHGHVEPLGPYEVGFEEAAARSRHVMAGVVAGSSAYRAGLRNGQRVVSWKVHRGDFRVPAEVVIDEGGANRTVSYLPQGKAVSVVQFSAEGELPAACGKLL